MARVALAEFVAARGTDTRPRIAIIARAGALERRIAQAFQSALRAEGEVPRLVEWAPDSARAVAKELGAMPLDAVFLALTARDAAQVRALIPRGAQVFGTSLLNAGDPRMTSRISSSVSPRPTISPLLVGTPGTRRLNCCSRASECR